MKYFLFLPLLFTLFFAGCGVDWFPDPNKSPGAFGNISTQKFFNSSTAGSTTGTVRTEVTPAGTFTSSTGASGSFTTMTSKGTFVTSQQVTVAAGTPITYVASINTTTKGVTSQMLVAGSTVIPITSVSSFSP